MACKHSEDKQTIMPEKIILEDGTEREVPTEEEEKANQEALDTAKKTSEDLDALKTEFEVPEGKDLNEFMKELKDDANPNFKAMREKTKNLETSLKAQGKEIDENGNIIEKEKSITEEDVINTTKKTMYESEKSKMLSQFTEEEKKVIEFNLNKLMTGEETTTENLQKFGAQAIVLSYPEKASNQLNSSINSNGRPPLAGKDPKKEMTSEAKDLGMKEFGLSEDDFKKETK